MHSMSLLCTFQNVFMIRSENSRVFNSQLICLIRVLSTLILETPVSSTVVMTAAQVLGLITPDLGGSWQTFLQAAHVF